MDQSYWNLKLFIFHCFSSDDLICAYMRLTGFEEPVGSSRRICPFLVKSCVFAVYFSFLRACHVQKKSFLSWTDIKRWCENYWLVSHLSHSALSFRDSFPPIPLRSSLSLSLSLWRLCLKHIISHIRKKQHWFVLLLFLFSDVFVGCNEWMKRRNVEEENWNWESVSTVNHVLSVWWMFIHAFEHNRRETIRK